MGLTPKQVRNGIPPMPPAGGNVAQPGPSANVDSVMGAAEAYGNAWEESGREAWTGATPGSAGYAVADWDDSIAVTEQPGEA